MSAIEYSDLDTLGQLRQCVSRDTYSCATDVAAGDTNSLVNKHFRAITITAARVVITATWSTGTNVTVTLGVTGSSSDIGSKVITLAQGVVGSAHAFTLPTGGYDVDADTSVIMTGTKSGSMTGGYMIQYDYKFKV